MASSPPAFDVSKYGLPRFFGRKVMARLAPSPPPSVEPPPPPEEHPVTASATPTARAVRPTPRGRRLRSRLNIVVSFHGARDRTVIAGGESGRVGRRRAAPLLLPDRRDPRPRDSGQTL